MQTSMNSRPDGSLMFSLPFEACKNWMHQYDVKLFLMLKKYRRMTPTNTSSFQFDRIEMQC